MRLAVAAVSCGLASFLAACSGGPSAPAGATDAASTTSGGPFAPVAAPGPFAPVAAPGPFAPQPGGTTAYKDLCPEVCARAELLGCPDANCLADCADVLAQLPEVCRAAYGAYNECRLVDATCGPNGRIDAAGCGQLRLVYLVCIQAAQPNAPNGPAVPRPDGGQVVGP